MTTSSTIPGERPYFRPRRSFRPRAASKPYTGPPTRLQIFLAEHAEVIEHADALTRNGPVHADDALPAIMRATGKDRLTITQALYAAGQRVCYDLVVPVSWWQKSGEARGDDLDNAWRFRQKK